MGRLDALDLSKHVGKHKYEEQIEKLQLELLTLQRAIIDAQRAVVIGYEGADAAGKGGSIKRLIGRLDPRGYRVHPIGAPTPEELRYNYLHRFWVKLPPRGVIGIFDRTWYGRVLVERVEGFATEAEWRRAYDEINAFERALVDDGTILVKFWLQISDEEQLKRFKERESDPYKIWKITPDDWRNRAKRPQYEAAAEEMFDRTDTPAAPWTILAAEDKHYARIETIKVVVRAIEDGLGRTPKSAGSAS